jgi:hypothetical protein
MTPVLVALLITLPDAGLRLSQYHVLLANAAPHRPWFRRVAPFPPWKVKTEKYLSTSASEENAMLIREAYILSPNLLQPRRLSATAFLQSSEKLPTALLPVIRPRFVLLKSLSSSAV